ncbi:MAG: GNAT family N-acetyltransferase [Oscillospiraceae bacterium]|nr:GNAT family N-acetyltransferase [Oscillospiraceae bacterium]
MRKIKEVFADIPSFETKRLLLRRIYDVDYIDMHEYSADSDVTKYLVWRPHTSLAETKNYACGLQKKYKSGKFFDWGLVLKETGKLIGTCGFTSVNLNKNSCEVGYVLSRKYWGRGLMPEALELVMDFAFTYFKFDRVEARFLEGNTKSLRVMQKMGMVLDRVDYNSFNVKGEIKNVHNYYITRDMFEMRKYALNYI